MKKNINIVWFRNDLRVDDNPALFNAWKTSDQLIAVYFLSYQQDQYHNLGNNHKRLRLKALSNLKQKLAELNIPLLIIESQNYVSVVNDLHKICERLSINQLFFNREHAFNERTRDTQVTQKMQDTVFIRQYNGDCLVEPGSILNQAGLPYKVFTPFANQVRKILSGSELFCYIIPSPMPVENFQLLQEAKKTSKYQDCIKQTGFEDGCRVNLDMLEIQSVDLKTMLNTQQTIDEPRIDKPLIDVPRIDEIHLRGQLLDFVINNISSYEQERNFPNLESTSQLSFGLAVGAISVRRCYQIAKDREPTSSDCWLNELIWRDFYRYVMWHFPHVSKKRGFRSVDSNLVWSTNNEQLGRWKRGQTGIPIIDAAMRQLITTGWMHNRLRMITACYLCKNLWIDWRQGEVFFAQHLFDYDFASNNGGWQWCASVGTDAAPYFRVFNPANQQKRFDPEANFIKKWLPELANYNAKEIHNFESKAITDYYPIQTDLKYSRKLAIEHFKQAMT